MSIVCSKEICKEYLWALKQWLLSQIIPLISIYINFFFWIFSSFSVFGIFYIVLALVALCKNIKHHKRAWDQVLFFEKKKQWYLINFMISWQIEREIERQILLQYWHFYFHVKHLITDVSVVFLFLKRDLV